ncbi:hypothetical protein Poly21_16760 [Allorhodopirellula heiligendammensis]|uniref:Uncharacterized protein n=1 Tax=Allorhodopirellula heiligendammensis TaxID=2714739 RepID=A0A5C6C4M5_9BACT|nr:hypothetical protein Poly21_16760 [Allorhodopirellula heiligendammensis]
MSCTALVNDGQLSLNLTKPIGFNVIRPQDKKPLQHPIAPPLWVGVGLVLLGLVGELSAADLYTMLGIRHNDATLISIAPAYFSWGGTVRGW